MENVKSFLIIGYGNQLRGDDGIGQEVARLVQEWEKPNVRSRSVHQLTPEIAEELTHFDYAIFVDASITGEVLEVSSLTPDDSEIVVNLGHSINPRSLLSLAKTLYEYTPQAWLVAVPGDNFDLGDRLSPTGEEGVNHALTQIQMLIDTYSNTRPNEDSN